MRFSILANAAQVNLNEGDLFNLHISGARMLSERASRQFHLGLNEKPGSGKQMRMIKYASSLLIVAKMNMVRVQKAVESLEIPKVDGFPAPPNFPTFEPIGLTSQPETGSKLGGKKRARKVFNPNEEASEIIQFICGHKADYQFGRFNKLSSKQQDSLVIAFRKGVSTNRDLQGALERKVDAETGHAVLESGGAPALRHGHYINGVPLRYLTPLDLKKLILDFK
ncbi:MAG: hypothetical protein ACI9BD_000751 [Candidatus Marinamargulisbacteria bacterium]|jgi:hypothetical protein